MCDNNPKCLAMSYNNLACYQRATGHPRNGLIALERALEIESDMRGDDNNDSKAETHLNTCAVLSDMSYHDLAM